MGTSDPIAVRVRELTDGTTMEQAAREALGAAFPAGILVNSYRKRVAAHLAYDHADSAAARTKWGSLYPQSFVIDQEADEVFILSQGPKIVSVYTFSTGAYKRVFCLRSAGSPEGAVIRHEGVNRYLYTAHGPGNLGKWDITTLPANLSEPAPVSVRSGLDLQNTVTYRNGVWTMSTRTADHGPAALLNRGRFYRYDENFNQVGMLEIPSILAGGLSGSAYAASAIPKFQGFCEGPGVFAMSMGGGWLPTDIETPYHYQGLRMFSGNGEVLVDSLVTASGMRAKLNAALGISAGIIENEGVTYAGGKFYSLTALTGSGSALGQAGGLMIFEEFSTAPDAIDFSEHAVTWVVDDVMRSSVANHPKALDGKLHNRVTWEPLDTLPKIFDYLRNMGQPRLSFYSSDVTITDVGGSNLPPALLVEVENVNNGLMLVTTKGAAGIALSRYQLQGAMWVKLSP